jgi:subtilisin family serine protease
MSGPQRPPEGFLSTLRRIICRLLCGDTPTPPPPPPPPPAKEPLRSFEPGQVAIMAEFPPELELTPRQIVDRVAARLDQVNIDGKERVVLAPERVTILRGPRLTLATVLGDVPAARQDPARLIRFVDGLHQAIRKPPLETIPLGQGPIDRPEGTPEQTGEPQQPAGEAGERPAPIEQAPLAARALAPDADGFDLRAASPNWFASGSKNIIGGGPGGWPAGATPATNPSGPQPWDFDVPPTLQAPILGAIDVEVAILDTTPALADLLSAHATWVGNDPVPPPQPPNVLLRSLLAGPSGGPFNVADRYGPTAAVGPNDVLDVVYMPGLVPLTLGDFPYPIPSHGLFIAGIIRSAAPKAKLRLIQALNNEGGGSLTSITQALACANHAGRIAPLVINCSFAMQIPRPGDTSIPPDMQGVPQATIDSLTQTLHDTFALISQLPDVVIVAAAGNAGSGGSHPLARFPAALEAVAGVAALKQDDNNDLTPPELADYSAQADDQPAEGFAAFGGEATSSDPSVADAAKGMLGVFIEAYPIPGAAPGSYSMQPNSSGWARWAGTSFAAPIVSAILANLLSEGRTPSSAVQVLDLASDDVGVQNAVPVKQQS